MLNNKNIEKITNIVGIISFIILTTLLTNSFINDLVNNEFYNEPYFNAIILSMVYILLLYLRKKKGFIILGSLHLLGSLMILKENINLLNILLFLFSSTYFILIILNTIDKYKDKYNNIKKLYYIPIILIIIVDTLSYIKTNDNIITTILEIISLSSVSIWIYYYKENNIIEENEIIEKENKEIKEKDINIIGKSKEIKKIKELLDNKAITKEEYNELKNKILNIK